MKKYLLMALLMVVSMTMMGQNRHIEGLLVDKDSEEAMPLTTVQLLKTDSTYVTGAVTNDDGLFVIEVPEAGQYLLKISNVGYTTTIKKVEIDAEHDLNMGKIVMAADAVMLKNVTATAQALKVTVVEDTFVYNSAAYRTPEGSAVEELVKLIPGATVDEEGNVTINGKQVKKIKMDGKEFMNGDTQTALKNLPTAIVEKVKAYEGKSDRSRITGIYDGEDEMTLDFTIKKGMNKGVLGNIDASYGTHDRYAERLMAAVFKDRLKLMTFGNFNNVNDAGFGGRGGGWGGRRNGQNTNNMLGVNFNYENTGKLKWDGSVRWNHRTADILSKSSSESFVIGKESFSNSLSQRYTKSKSWNANMRIEWTPDTLTNISFRPSLSWSDNDSRSGSSSATFDKDPFENTNYQYTTEQIPELIDAMKALGLAKNSRTGSSLGYGDTKSASLWFQIFRKLNSAGRGITFAANGSVSESKNNSFSTNNVKLYQKADSDYSTNRYNLTPSNNWNFYGQVSYSEPIAEKTYLQFSYKYSQSYRKSDRVTYDFSTNGNFAHILDPNYVNILASLGYTSIPEYRRWDDYVADNFADYEDVNLSRLTKYQTYTHDVELQFRRVRDKYNFNFGVLAQPQKTKFFQKYLGQEKSVTRDVFNVSPTADFRYYFSRQHQLQFNYRGWTSQPSVENMMDIVDDSDPMNITIGNPNLKPSFTNNFNFRYNNVLTKGHYQVINAYGDFSTTRNATASCVYYDALTGGQTVRYDNINGNWNAGGNVQYNIALDSLARWNLSVESGYRHQNSVGYVAPNEDGGKFERNTSHLNTFNERLAISFRNSWLNIEPDGQLNYVHSTNKLKPSANLDTWTFTYGTNLNITCPWGMTVSSDIHMRSRRGFSDETLNTNELLWNAQIAQSFLRAKNLTVSLQFYDILKNQSNISRQIDAMRRSDTEYNSINSYALLHVIYRFNIMGGKDMRQQMEQGRPDFNRPDMRRQGPPQGGGRPF